MWTEERSPRRAWLFTAVANGVGVFAAVVWERPAAVGGAQEGLATAEAMFVGEHEADQAGSAVAAAGDVDGDGHADLLVGAVGEASGGGAVYLLQGPVTGSIDLAPADAKWIGQGHAGWSMAGVGDLDADGLDDLLLGDPLDDSNGIDAGAAWLVLGSSL